MLTNTKLHQFCKRTSSVEYGKLADCTLGSLNFVPSECVRSLRAVFVFIL
jgi:hypothetical protein